MRAESGGDVGELVRAFWDQLCSIAPRHEARLIDFAELERAQREAARPRPRRRQSRPAGTVFTAELVFAKPGLAAQRRRPN